MTLEDARLVGFTVGMAALAVSLALPGGIALGWLLARRSWVGKSLVETLLMMPLVMPPVVTGLILLKLFGRNGPLGRWLEAAFGIETVFTWRAVVLALAVMSFPLLVRCVRSAFEGVPRQLEESAATLGKSPWQVFWRISLPLARRGVVAGVVLGFARALGEFGATVMVAGFMPGLTETLPLAIYRSVQMGEDARAWWLAGLSGLIAFAAIWYAERWLRAGELVRSTNHR